jgi:hypothetical protein
MVFSQDVVSRVGLVVWIHDQRVDCLDQYWPEFLLCKLFRFHEASRVCSARLVIRFAFPSLFTICAMRLVCRVSWDLEGLRLLNSTGTCRFLGL